MTQRKITTSNLSEYFPQINRVALGFEPFFAELEKRFDTTIPNYPPYNVIKDGEYDLIVEVAVAGFAKEDISIQHHEGKLTITGAKDRVELSGEAKYQHKGISSRSFKLSWKLAEYYEVVNATLTDGILSVEIVQEVPEEAKPKLIDIK